MRASQVPRRELRGIKAENISRNDLSLAPSPQMSHSPYGSRPTTPRRPSDTSNNLSPTPTYAITRHQPSSSIDSSAQVSLQSQQERESQYILPRRSLLQYSPPEVFTRDDEVEESPVESCFEASITSEASAPYDVPIATFNGGAYDFMAPHAVTTPDDAAHLLMPPPFEMVRTELSSVIEEDEHSEGRRSSTMTLTRRPSTADSSLQHLKSVPDTQQSLEHCRDSIAETYRESIQCSPKKQRRSIKIMAPSFDDAVGDVPFTRLSQQFSTTVKDTEGNWEDLVDWCYEHNAEADCNFDFTRAASPTPETSCHTPAIDDGSANAMHPLDRDIYSDHFKTRRSSSVYSIPSGALLPLETSVPDLEPVSAISTQSSFDGVSEAVTPIQSAMEMIPPPSFSLPPSKPNFSKPIGYHSPHVSNDLTSQEIYEDLCQELYTRDCYQYGRVDGSTISSASPRSSRSPISKSSSQESFWVRRHTNNNSAGSLPDLITSRFSRERNEQFPELIAEQTSASSTVEEPQLPAARRRSPSSLMKDVAQKNLLSRIQNGCIDDATNAEVPLPLHPALRDRAGSDAAFRDPEVLLPPPFMRPNATRMRSASSAASIKSVNISPRASRASYGLYPQSTAR